MNKIMPTKKKVEKKETKKKKVVFKEYKIVDSNNVSIRIFDTKRHGKDASKLAEGFIKKNKRRAWKITKVEEPTEYPSNYTSTIGEKKI